MTLSGIIHWLSNAITHLRTEVWPPLPNDDGVDAEPDDERRWLEEERRVLPYLYWPNI
jgi:hypothetical protein